MRRLLSILFLILIMILGIMPSFAQTTMMNIRVAHFSPDAPAVDIYVNGDVVIEGLEYPDVSAWMELENGNYDIAVAPTGTSLNDAVIGPSRFNLVRGTWITVAAVGSAEANTLAYNVLFEDYSTIPDNASRISVAHAIVGGPEIDLVSDGVALLSRLAYPGTRGRNDGFFIRTIEAGSTDFNVVLSRDPFIPVIEDTQTVQLDADTNYLIALIGTDDDPHMMVIGSSLDGEVAMASSTISDDAMTDAEAVAEDETASDETTDEAVAEDEASADEMTDDEMTEDAVSTEEAPDGTMTEDETSTDETTDEAMTEDEASADEMTDYEMTEDAVSTEEAPDDEMAEDEASTEETPDVAMTEEVSDDEMAEVEILSDTIAGILVDSAEAEEPEFTILLAAVQAADESILAMLNDPDATLTVFAPTDVAFMELLETLDIGAETLLADTELLNSVLPYHVLVDIVTAETIAMLDGEAIPTAHEDATIVITLTDGEIMLNDAINVITTDMSTDNGVIHVIDGVLVPEATE